MSDSASSAASRADRGEATQARLIGLALLVQLIWAINNALSKFALAEIPSLLLGSVRMSLCALILLPLYFALRKPGANMPTRAQWVKLILLGALGVGANQLLFVVGIARTSVSHGALILPLTPLMTLLLSALLGLEKITPRKLLGMGIAFSGVLVLQLSKTPSPGASLLGDFILFIGVIAFASYIVLGKRASANFDGLFVNTVGFCASAAMLLPVTVWGVFNFDFSHVTLRAWASLCYMCVFSSIVGYMLYYYVLTHMAPSRLSAFSYLQPVMTTSAAALLLGEPITSSLITAGALVLLGVWVTERSRRVGDEVETMSAPEPGDLGTAEKLVSTGEPSR